MLEKKEFNEIRDKLKEFDIHREETIQSSREIISLSKQIIYASQREDYKGAEKPIKQIKSKISSLRTANFDTNINKVAFQEYVEAICFYEFLKTGKLPSYKKLNVEVDDYLMGLCDLTGELGRKAIFDVIHKNYKKAKEIKDLVNEIYGEFLKLNLRNGELRKKADTIKWNLKKLEEVMYDLAIKGK